jgi:prevent-host-death family protein
MDTHPLHLARAEFSKVIDRALAGEPQRVTRYGKDALVIVSEIEWNRRSKSASTLADLFLEHTGNEDYEELFGQQPWKDDHPLGSDFLDEQ